MSRPKRRKNSRQPQRAVRQDQRNSVVDNPDESTGVLEAISRLDSWYNEQTGFGGLSKSKMQNTAFGSYLYIGRDEAERLYRFDWAARKAIDAPIFDAMRGGIDFVEDDGQESAVEQLEDELKRLKARKYLKDGLTEAWKQGGALIVFTFDDPLDPIEPLNPATVRGIKRIDVVQGGRGGLAQPYQWYYSEEQLGQPEVYNVTLNYQSIAKTIQVHESRCIRLDSPFTTSQISRVRNAGWNDSRYQTIYEAIRSYGVAVQAGEETLENFTISVLKMADLAEKIKASGNADGVVLTRILALINKVTTNRVALIGSGEEFERHGTPLAGFHELMDRYAKYVAAASWIPLSRFFSGEGGELNGNTMDGDTLNYYDWVKEIQESDVRAAYEKFIEFISYYMGFDPAKVDFRFPSLWQQSEKERADTYLVTAQGDQIYMMNGAVDPMDVARSRFGGKEVDLTSMHVDFAELEAQRELDKQSAEQAEQAMQDDQGADGQGQS